MTAYPPIHSPRAWRELLDERVAIMVVDGGVAEADALREVRDELAEAWRRLRREHVEACVARSNARRDHEGMLRALEATGRPRFGFVYREGRLIPAALDGELLQELEHEVQAGRKGPPSLAECQGALEEWRAIVDAHTDVPQEQGEDVDGEEETDHEVASDDAPIGQGADHEPSLAEQPSTAPQVSTSSLVGAVESELPAFQTLYADPPWLERGGGKSKRGADRHYDLLPWWDIVRVIYQSGAWNPADDAHLWMWVTANHREDGHRVAEALGFRPLTEVAWVKRRPASAEDLERVLQLALEDGQRERALAELRALQDRRQVGLGQYLRGAHEVCMLCVRGRGAQVRTEARDIPSVLFAPRTRHSEKPAEMRELIERRSKGPRLELFARHTAPGWHAWGNQVGLLGGA